MVIADIVTLLIPVWILLGLLVLLGVLALLGRIQNGRYLRPIVSALAKVPLFRKGLQKASTAALERSNPELGGEMKKIQRTGAVKESQRGEAAIPQLTREERRALLEMQEQQGVGPAP